MENCGNLFFISGDNNHHHRDIWSLNTTVTTANNVSASSLYGGDGSHLHPDPHLMCLKVGKRHYFEETTHQLATTTSSGVSPKRRKSYYALAGGGGGSSASAVVGSSGTTAVPRCQVEGCHVALVNAKDYHRRHKVCEMHSKAPKVIVVGLEQRFCQQCSRFHVLSEFDETKRSCRRRLAGHNERRRKSSHDSASKNTASQGKLIMGRFQYLTSPTGSCARSLLSSKSDSNWISSSSSHHDISSRSSAALRELIAEHRATFLARQLILDRNFHHHHHTIEDLPDHHHQSHPSVNATSNSLITPHQHLTFAETSDWDRINDSTCSHLTLDLMQAPNSAFGFLPTRGKNNEEEEDECSELRNTLEGTYVV